MIKKIIVTAILFCIALVVGALFYLSPAFRPFPQPSGNYGVGVIIQSFNDPSRSEIHAKNPSPREIVVDFYYPTQKPTTLKQYPYNPAYTKALAHELAQHSWIPEFVWRQLFRGIASYAQPNATMATTEHGFPLILFSHGIGADALYHGYLEELASHGYIIASVYHPYDTAVTVFPSGRILPLDPEFRTMIEKNDRDKIYPYRGKACQIWLADLKFLLDQTELMDQNSASFFYKKIDLNNIGALGHSHGGSVVIEFVRTDPRVKAGIDMDGWTKTCNKLDGFDKPFMTMTTDALDFSQPFTGGMTGWDIFLKNMQSNKNASIVAISGAQHTSFSDYIQLKWPLGMWASKADRIRNEIQQNAVNFFDRYLKGK